MTSFMEPAERPSPYHHRPRAESGGASPQCQGFRYPRTSLGAAGHWIHMGAVVAPLIIGEVIKDPDQRWRALRLASVGAALASEALWTHRLKKERQKDDYAREALESCSELCR